MTDHRAKAERFLTRAEDDLITDGPTKEASLLALLGIGHAILAEPAHDTAEQPVCSYVHNRGGGQFSKCILPAGHDGHHYLGQMLKDHGTDTVYLPPDTQATE